MDFGEMALGLCRIFLTDIFCIFIFCLINFLKYPPRYDPGEKKNLNDYRKLPKIDYSKL